MSRTASLALIAALCTPPMTASASDEVYTVIRDQGAAANAAFSAGDYQNAARLYESVEGLLQTVEGRDKELAIVRFNLGRCYDELGQSVQALEAYRRSLEGPLDAQLADPIRERVRALESEALGRIVVRCAAPGEGTTVEIVGQGAREACGHMFAGLAPGPHVVLARTPDGREQRLPAEVVAGATSEVTVRAPETDDGVDVLAWSLTGGAVLVLGGGLALNLAGFDALDEADALTAQIDEATGQEKQDLIAERDAADDRARTYGAASYALFAVGGLLAAGATWAWLADDDDEAVALTPWVGPSGLGLVGRF